MIRRRWLKGTVVVSLVLCAALGLAACGGGSSTASQQEIARAERHARLEKAEKEKERKLEREIEKLKRERLGEKKRQKEKERRDKKEAEAHVAAPLTPAPAPPEFSGPEGTDCGDGVTAGPETSCGFALAVRSEYESFIGEGSGTIEAYSEANKEFYSMYCTAAPHECSGAISATVYFP